MACPACALLDRLKIDDPVGCVPTHGIAGIWGLVAVAFFAEKDILQADSMGDFGIFKGGSWRFLGVQLLAAVAISAWSALTTFLELLFVDKLVGLRMSLEEELLGADKVEHGIDYGYPTSCGTEKINDRSNHDGVTNTAFSAEEEIERPPTAPSLHHDQQERHPNEPVHYDFKTHAWQ